MNSVHEVGSHDLLLLRNWVDAVEELSEAAERAVDDPAAAATGIALLHALQERSALAFDAYRRHVLRSAAT